MITTDCRECGAGPMDLPRDEICDECRLEDPAAKTAGWFPRPTVEHSAVIAGDHIGIHRYIRCSCDWEGSSWQGENQRAEDLAMDEWAEHVADEEGN